jgi:ABC-type cobalamin/Fe3+-siderophores transport system ATPase subunit
VKDKIFGRDRKCDQRCARASRGQLTRPFLSLFPYAGKSSQAPWRPILLLNATHEESGKRIITSHVLVERNVFIDALDALHVLDRDVRANTAAHNSARFSYGEGGVNLSGGHRQRIALAHAPYGEPALVVLDEPSSNLDMEGDAALASCLGKLKEQATTVVVISHRLASLNTVDKLLCLHTGAVAMFGPRREVLAKLGQPVALVTAEGGGTAPVGTVGWPAAREVLARG